MLAGFEKIVEERIQKALMGGEFDNLPGEGRPLTLDEDDHIPEELRLAYKILKNADCLPPEVQLRKEIHQTEELLAAMTDEAERYRTLKRLNLLIFKLNTLRDADVRFEIPEKYLGGVIDRLETNPARRKTT